jgi:hypothetical protein
MEQLLRNPRRARLPEKLIRQRWRRDMRIRKRHIACFLLLWCLVAVTVWHSFLRLHWARSSVDPNRWTRVEVGMTKKQVRWLLGAPSDTVHYQPAPREPGSRPQRYATAAHFWEFGGGGGFIQLTFRDAPRPNYNLHVIHFDNQSRVAAKEEPITQPDFGNISRQQPAEELSSAAARQTKP